MAARHGALLAAQQAIDELLYGCARQDPKLVIEQSPQVVIRAHGFGDVALRGQRAHLQQMPGLAVGGRRNERVRAPAGVRERRGADRQRGLAEALERLKAQLLHLPSGLLEPLRLVVRNQATRRALRCARSGSRAPS